MSHSPDIKGPPFLTSGQIRAARALLDWNQVRLAAGAEIGISTLRRAELAPNETRLTRVNDQAIRRTLEAAGIIFIDAEFGAGPGVRLLRPLNSED